MFRRSIRLIVLVAAMAVFGVLGMSSAALANGGHRHGHHGKRHHSHSANSQSDHQRCNGDTRGNDEGGNDQGGSDQGSSSGGCDDGDYSAWDEQWLTMSIEGDLFEIQGGRLALQKSQLPEVRNLANTLIQDHTKSLQDATELAQKYGIDVPTEPSPTQQWELQVVAQFSGTQFDQWYSSLEVADHKQDIKEAQDEVQDGCNGEFKSDASDEIPTLQHHLDLAQRALQASGGSTTSAASLTAKLRAHHKRHRHHHAHHSRTRH